MTAVSTQLQATQNTAPIVEFSCLYTHDLRRKAKRWHDGLLRYHTFNRRVMVYDLARNFIGDTFNQTGVDLEAGDELELEKDFALVEVSERTAVVQQDLTELNKSRQKKSPAKQSVKHTPVAPRTRLPIANQTQCTPVPTATRHRSLGAMLGTPRGPLGKAVVSNTSPFEERQARESGKKARHDSPRAASHNLLPPRQTTTTLNTPRRPNVVDLCSPESRTHPTTLSRKVSREGEREDNNASGAIPTVSPASEPGTDTTNPDMEDATQARPALRVISNAPRRMLLCQQRPNRKPTAQADEARKESLPQKEVENAPLDPQELRLQERLARIGQRRPRSPTPDASPPRKQRAIVNDSIQKPVSAPAEVQARLPQTRVPEIIDRKTAAPIRPFESRQGVHQVPPAPNRPALAARRVVVAPAAAPALPPAPPQPVDPLDSGPWSREALDLFDWWPPDRDKAGHKLASSHTV